jgi:hypothetical protein
MADRLQGNTFLGRVMEQVIGRRIARGNSTQQSRRQPKSSDSPKLMHVLLLAFKYGSVIFQAVAFLPKLMLFVLALIAL